MKLVLLALFPCVLSAPMSDRDQMEVVFGFGVAATSAMGLHQAYQAYQRDQQNMQRQQQRQQQGRQEIRDDVPSSASIADQVDIHSTTDLSQQVHDPVDARLPSEGRIHE